MYQSFEEMSMAFVACQQATFILQPAHGSFDFPAVAMTAQFATILPRRLFASVPMGSHKFGSPKLQRVSQPVRISGFVVQQMTNPLLCHADIHQCLNGIDFRILSGSREGRDWNPLTAR